MAIDLQRSRAASVNSNDGKVGRSVSGSNVRTTLTDDKVTEHPVVNHDDETFELFKDQKNLRSDKLRDDGSVGTSVDQLNSSNQPKNNRLNNDDLNNPTFEEAVAAIIDENGDIHIHDGPGGLFGYEKCPTEWRTTKTASIN